MRKRTKNQVILTNTGNIRECYVSRKGSHLKEAIRAMGKITIIRFHPDEVDLGGGKK